MIDIDITLFIQLINIGVLIAVMNIVLYKPVRTILEQRERKVADLGREIEQINTTAKLNLEEFDRKLTAARQKGKDELEQIRTAAQSAGTEKLAAIRSEADKEKSEQLAQIRGQFEGAERELKGQIATYAQEMAGKVLGRAL